MFVPAGINVLANPANSTVMSSWCSRMNALRDMVSRFVLAGGGENARAKGLANRRHHGQSPRRGFHAAELPIAAVDVYARVVRVGTRAVLRRTRRSAASAFANQ